MYRKLVFPYVLAKESITYYFKETVTESVFENFQQNSYFSLWNETQNGCSIDITNSTFFSPIKLLGRLLKALYVNKHFHQIRSSHRRCSIEKRYS